MAIGASNGRAANSVPSSLGLVETAQIKDIMYCRGPIMFIWRRPLHSQVGGKIVRQSAVCKQGLPVFTLETVVHTVKPRLSRKKKAAEKYCSEHYTSSKNMMIKDSESSQWTKFEYIDLKENGEVRKPTIEKKLKLLLKCSINWHDKVAWFQKFSF